MTTLYDIGQWYRHKGLVGETALALLQTVVAVSGKPMGFGIEAPSGSGKSATLDLLVGDKGRPDEALIYQKFIYFKDAGSATSMFYDQEAINAARLLVIKELQKDKSHEMTEAIKSMTEGKSANRGVTDITSDSVRHQEIKPKTVMYTLAIENDTKPDTELRRRCITISTDVSKEQTVAVLNAKAASRWDRGAHHILSDAEQQQIRKSVNSLMAQDYVILNPYAVGFVEYIASIAPDQKVRSMAEHFWNVLESVTKINAFDGNHVMFQKAGKWHVLTNVQDLLMTLAIYKGPFIRDIYSIPPLGDIVLRGFEDAKSVQATEKQPSSTDLSQFGLNKSEGLWVDVNHLRKAIKEKQSVVLAKNVVFQICRQLVDAGYLEDWKDGKETKYQVQQRFVEFSDPDTNALINKAHKMVLDKFPDFESKWVKAQETQWRHPITGEMKDV